MDNLLEAVHSLKESNAVVRDSSSVICNKVDLL
jgi:hypothetical protein